MPRIPDHPPPLPHDAAYKAMYSHRQAILDLCRYLAAPNGPLGPDPLAALDFSTLAKLPVGFEYGGPSDYERLLPAVGELRDAGLRRTVWRWVVRRARHDGVALEELDVEGTYFRSRIGENMRRATQAWFAEGRAEGVEEGLRRGLEQQRALLMRQITTKFGADASKRVESLLARVVDAALLVEVGGVLLVAGTETELVERVEAVLGSEALSSGR